MTQEEYLKLIQEQGEQMSAPEYTQAETPQTMQNLLAQYDQQQRALLADQAANIEQQKQDIIQARQTPKSFNYAPLLSFADYMTGENQFSKMIPYSEYESEADRRARLSELQEKLNTYQKNLAEQNLGSLRTKLQAYQARQQDATDREMLKQRAIQERFGSSQLLRKETALQQDLEKSVFKPMSEYENMSSNMEELIKTGTKQSVQQALGAFARGVAAEKGVLTDTDIARLYPKSLEMSLADAEAWITSNPNTELPKPIIANLLKGIQISRKNSSEVFGRAIKTKENLYKGRQSMQDVMGEGGFGQAAFDEARTRLGGFKTGYAEESTGITQDMQEKARALLEKRKQK